MKYLLILSVCIVLSICAGCSSGEHASTKKEDMKIVCIDGVEYFLWRESAGNAGFGYMSVKFKKDGNVSTCGN